MKPDRIERAHLRDPRDRSHTTYRYPAPTELAGLAQRFWIPVWLVTLGREAGQQVLQYPCGLIVITPEYARFYGVVAGLSPTTLTGDGWAVGIMLEHAGGFLVAGRPMAQFRDRHVDLADVAGDATTVVGAVRASMRGPRSAVSQTAARPAMSGMLHRFGPVDGAGVLDNDVVAFHRAGSRHHSGRPGR
jgi:hypothetical protein